MKFGDLVRGLREGEKKRKEKKEREKEKKEREKEKKRKKKKKKKKKKKRNKPSKENMACAVSLQQSHPHQRVIKTHLFCVFVLCFVSVVLLFAERARFLYLITIDNILKTKKTQKNLQIFIEPSTFFLNCMVLPYKIDSINFFPLFKNTGFLRDGDDRFFVNLSFCFVLFSWCFSTHLSTNSPPLHTNTN